MPGPALPCAEARFSNMTRPQPIVGDVPTPTFAVTPRLANRSYRCLSIIVLDIALLPAWLCSMDKCLRNFHGELAHEGEARYLTGNVGAPPRECSSTVMPVTRKESHAQEGWPSQTLSRSSGHQSAQRKPLCRQQRSSQVSDHRSSGRHSHLPLCDPCLARSRR